jgi:hypothetical protein
VSDETSILSTEYLTAKKNTFLRKCLHSMKLKRIHTPVYMLIIKNSNESYLNPYALIMSMT